MPPNYDTSIADNNETAAPSTSAVYLQATRNEWKPSWKSRLDVMIPGRRRTWHLEEEKKSDDPYEAAASFVPKPTRRGVSQTESEVMVSEETPPTKSVGVVQYLGRVLLTVGVAHLGLEASLAAPAAMAPSAAAKTYVPAWYSYDKVETRFDNTIWTWGTDYLLGCYMLLCAYLCLTATTHPVTRKGSWRQRFASWSDPSLGLRWRSCCLLICYAASVIAGGFAHQTYLSLEEMNTWHFRVWWVICVGNVTMACAYVGAIGVELFRKFHLVSSTPTALQQFMAATSQRIPHVSDSLWLVFGIYLTAVCAAGGISYKRPACDIFIAGSCQLVPTVYSIAVVLTRTLGAGGGGNVPNRRIHVPGIYKFTFILSFLSNSPLLPMYPLLVQYTTLSLGSVNSLLHTWLTVSWSLQFLSLYQICLALSKTAPLKQT